MRRKLILGMLCVAVIAITAAAYLLQGTSDAQEAPNKADGLPPPPEKKSEDLFEKLKKELTVLPALPTREDAPKPPAKEHKAPPVLPTKEHKAPPVLPGKEHKVPPVLPALPGMADGPMPPVHNIPPPNLPSIVNGPATEPQRQSAPMPMRAGDRPPSFKPPVAERQNAPSPYVPGDRGPAPLPVRALGKQTNNEPVIPVRVEVTPDQVTPTAEPPSSRPMMTPGAVPLKNSPWSLHVDLVNDETVVTATVNKKNRFKIICRHVDLQTAQSVFKAAGKVRVIGEAMEGSCENLAIALYEDRLTLEGVAEVRIRKTTPAASGVARFDVFELKGNLLSLRISELQSAGSLDATWNRMPDPARFTPVARVVAGDVAPPPPSAPVGRTIADNEPAGQGKKWSPYGKVRAAKIEHQGEPVWCLEDNDGQPIIHFVTRGNLAAYEGRTVSVFGAVVEQSASRTLMRVSHIAVP